ncbi:MAG: carbohydrate binding domain-containing protein [Sedimentisphaerales bacterium]
MADDANVVETDYYRAFVNTDGSLNIVEKSTGVSILSNSPLFYFDYGETNCTPTIITVPNASFEIDDNNDGIPDGWSIDESYIRISSEKTSSGGKSLKFDAAIPDTQNRIVYSPLLTVSQGAQYTISIDSYISSFTTGSVQVLVYYYASADGSGTAKTGARYVIQTTAYNSWVTNMVTWRPPANAGSFKIIFYMSSSTVATVYFDNLKVTEKDFLYTFQHNPISHNLLVNGNDTTITASDDTNPYVTVNYTYKMNNHSPYIDYSVALQYKQDILVSEERCDFNVPDLNARVMTRDFALIPFQSPNTYNSDTYTPRIVEFDNGLSFPGSDTMESMRLTRTASSSYLINFYLDYTNNHPHFYYPKHSNSVVYTNETIRKAGYSYTASVTFAVDTNTTLSYLVKTRQPYGYDALLTLSNHADNETLDRNKAVAYGTSDESDPNYGSKGIVGRGIGWTKSVFVSGASPYASLADVNFKAFTDRLYEDGVEIIGHSITPDTDSRPVVSSGLETLSQYHARDWIDHGAGGGTNNWEDLASQGAIKGDNNYILDLLEQYNYQYAWSSFDVGTTDYALNMLVLDSPSRIVHLFCYNNQIDNNIEDNKRIYLWSTENTGKHPEDFYTIDRVDALISERGVHIGHEYLGYSALENHAWYNAGNNVKITPVFDSELEYIAQKRSEDLIWSPTVANMGDYLVTLKDIIITYLADGDVKITNNSSVPLTGVTLLAQNSIKSVKINDYNLVSFGGFYGDKEIVLPTLEHGEAVELAISYGQKDALTPVIESTDTGKKKVNEITAFWDEPNKTLTMTAEARDGNYSFTASMPAIPPRFNRIFTVKDVTLDSIIGQYVASVSGTINFTVPLGSFVHKFQIIETSPVTLIASVASIDDFNTYGNDNQLESVWMPLNISVHLNTDTNYVYNGNQSMQCSYQSGSEVRVNTDNLPYQVKSDWTFAGAKGLELSFYGNSSNSILPIYVKLSDGINERMVAYGLYGEDLNDLRVPQWHRWIINTRDFNTAGVDLMNVKYMYIGFGSGTGSGSLYFADIRLCKPESCLLSMRSADFARLDFAPAGNPCGDCVIDFQELDIIAQGWLTTPPLDANADLNGDGIINFKDFAIFASMWLQTDL